MKLTKHYSIYVYQDPRTYEFFYVGSDARFGKRGNNWHFPHAGPFVNNKLYKLERLGLKPIIHRLIEFDECDNAYEKLKDAEIYWIAEGKRRGWPLTNNTDGGDGLLGRKHTKEEIRKITFARHNRRSGMLGKHHTEETKENMKMSQLRRVGRIAEDGTVIHRLLREKKSQKGKNNHFYGKKHSEETRRKMKENQTSKKTDEFRKLQSEIHSKSVVCLNDGLVFVSTNEASSYYNISASSIAACARGLRKSKTTKGKRFIYEDQEN
ncbi:MAG: NUMOD3 domain-containing DNA-binding protein [Candidatus Shapirobacteria bacterium]|jgi:group I intron endonuclease